jgi:pilus assembly protein CpaB
MWKVKRMNTARIVVLAIANGAGVIAARPARGFDGKPYPTALALRFPATDAVLPRIPVNRAQR